MDDRKYHHGDLRAALLAAAEAELAERGVEAFSLRQVAKRAGVSHAAPAHHFGDAQGLLTALAAVSAPSPDGADQDGVVATAPATGVINTPFTVDGVVCLPAMQVALEVRLVQALPEFSIIRPGQWMA